MVMGQPQQPPSTIHQQRTQVDDILQKYIVVLLEFLAAAILGSIFLSEFPVFTKRIRFRADRRRFYEYDRRRRFSEQKATRTGDVFVGVKCSNLGMDVIIFWRHQLPRALYLSRG